MIQGIDVSIAQGLITLSDWRQVLAKGIRYVYAKSGNGNEAPDPRFMANTTGAKMAGLAVGAYHVGFPLPDDPAHLGRDAVAQATSHYDASRAWGTNEGELPPCLDFEWPTPDLWPEYKCHAAQVAAWGLEYLAAAEKLWNRKPIIYTFPWFWNAVSKADVAAYADYPLFLARYGLPYGGPVPNLAPWKAPTFWQTSDGGGRLPSSAHVDEDEFLGSEADFAALRLGAPVARGPADQPPLLIPMTDAPYKPT